VATSRAKDQDCCGDSKDKGSGLLWRQQGQRVRTVVATARTTEQDLEEGLKKKCIVIM
jgi:hypothetical protein